LPAGLVEPLETAMASHDAGTTRMGQVKPGANEFLQIASFLTWDGHVELHWTVSKGT